MMEKKEYLLDGIPVSAWTLIEEAAYLSRSYQERGFCTSSEAAAILREHNHTVSENKNKEENDDNKRSGT